MRNLYILFFLLMFIIHKDACILGATTALTFWSKNLFPILFPTFIIVDLLLSSSLVNLIARVFGKPFKCIFKTSEYSAFIFIISMLCGTPTNAKILKNLYDEGIITQDDITSILSFSILFNPFLIISFAGIKMLIILWISNIITGIILRNRYVSTSSLKKIVNIPFSLNNSIANAMNVTINILGSVAVFMCISYVIPFINPFINVFTSSLLELSTALFKNKMYFNSEYFYAFMLSFGGISILTQIKSILKDTYIDYKFLLCSRIITTLVSLFICWLT